MIWHTPWWKLVSQHSSGWNLGRSSKTEKIKSMSSVSLNYNDKIFMRNLGTRDFNMFQLPKESWLAWPQGVDHCIWTLLLDDQGPAQKACKANTLECKQSAPEMRAENSYVGEVEATALDFQPLELPSNLFQTVNYVLHLVSNFNHRISKLCLFTIIFSSVRKASRGQWRNTAEFRLLVTKLIRRVGQFSDLK